MARSTSRRPAMPRTSLHPALGSGLRIAQLLGLATIFAAVLLTPGCADGPRERYFESRSTVITSARGDGTAILSPATAEESLARSDGVH